MRPGLTKEGAAIVIAATTLEEARRIVVKDAHVENWLNGVKLLEYELWSSDWTARVAKSKFNPYPGFGKAKRGHIAIQDHDSKVGFRNIKIRTL